MDYQLERDLQDLINNSKEQIRCYQNMLKRDQYDSIDKKAFKEIIKSLKRDIREREQRLKELLIGRYG